MKPLFLVLFLGLATDVRAFPPSYVGMDGQTHTTPTNMSAADLAKHIEEIRSQMYANSGSVGLRDSFAAQQGWGGGEHIISTHLIDTLEELYALALEQRMRSDNEHLRKVAALERRRDANTGDEWRKIHSELEKLLTEPRARAVAQARERRGQGWEKLVAPDAWGRATTPTELRQAVTYLDQQAREREAQISRYRDSLKTVRSEADRKSIESRLRAAESEHESLAYQEAPERRRLTLMEALPKVVAQTHDRLFEALPRALSGPFPPRLSPQLYDAVKAKLKTDAAYAERFQLEMRVHPQITERKQAPRDTLHISSAQGLELFLAAGDFHPNERPVNPTKVQINPNSRFDVNTTPLFARLGKEYGVKVGRKEGLRMVGTPSAATLNSAAGLESLSEVVGQSVAPSREMPPLDSRFSATVPNCDFAAVSGH